MIPTPTWLASLIAEAQHSVATGGTNIILDCRHAYRDHAYRQADGRIICPACAGEGDDPETQREVAEKISRLKETGHE